MNRYAEIAADLRARTRKWLVTGVAGFIGSNLLERLLKLDQSVVGLDNFSTGRKQNLADVKAAVAPQQWDRFHFMEGDIRNLETCHQAVAGNDIVLHQAALGSVPRSIADPLQSNDVNVSGFLNMLVAARDAGVGNFVYAASSSTYGDHPDLPKTEDRIGTPLSPYAVTKFVNELYAKVFATSYGLASIGLRYFNVFGPRQDPQGAYAAVIPRWIGAMLDGESVYINGDGETSRDFCFVENVLQANLLAATAAETARDNVYNIAVGQKTSLNQLYNQLRGNLADLGISNLPGIEYRDFRPGDVRHSLASIAKAADGLGYVPEFDVATGLEITCKWFVERQHSPLSHRSA